MKMNEAFVTFSQFNFHSNLNKALGICGYKEPTPVQKQAIPEILNHRDVVVSAPTGTGKTAAFVLPMLQQLSLKPVGKKTLVLILTPTRELATQINKAINTYGKFMRYHTANLVGGMSYYLQIKDLARGANIIVATPGRLLDHLKQKRVDLSHIEMLVLDEADRMLDMGFIDDVKYIAEQIPAHRQTLLFSATIDNKLTTVIKSLLKNPVRINLSAEKITAPQIKQELYKANSAQHKLHLLKHFLNDATIYKAIIFSATKMNADHLANQLCANGFSAAALHGDLKQNVRNRTLEKLRQGKIQFLVATDVAARGIDIHDISHVINYDLPKFCEDYVHRIGRTGRAGKTGIAISFVLPSDIRHVKRIEKFIGQRIQLIQNVSLHHTDKMMPAHSFTDHDRTHQHSSDHQKRKDKKSATKGWSQRNSSRKHDKKQFSTDPSHQKKKQHQKSFPKKVREFSRQKADDNSIERTKTSQEKKSPHFRRKDNGTKKNIKKNKPEWKKNPKKKYGFQHLPV